MRRVRATVAYVGASGLPTMTSEYELTAGEAEVLALAHELRVELPSISDRLFLPLHALSILPRPDPAFVEYLTSGMCTVRHDRIVGTRPEYIDLLERFDGWWCHPWYHVSNMSPVTPSSRLEN